MAHTTSDGAVALSSPVSSESIDTDILPPQLRKLIEAEGDVDPSLEEIEQILEVIDLPSDVKRYLRELAALAEQVRKWEREAEAFVQFLVATADSALNGEHTVNVLEGSGAVHSLDEEAMKSDDVCLT